MPVKFNINNLLSASRAAILSPMAGTMDVTSGAVVGVADQQQVAFTGIESILEKTLTLEESIKLLSCFSISEKNTAPADGNDATSNLAPVYDVNLGNETDFKSILVKLFEEATQVNGETVSSGDTASAMLSDNVRSYLNSLLASNGLLDLLEASNVMSISVDMKKAEGALDMYEVIRGNRATRVDANAARAKRRLFLSQIPLSTISGYIKEGTQDLDFLPLKGGDSMTFVFDITVAAPTMTTTGKNATADLDGSNVQDGGSNPAVTSLGKYGMTVALNAPPVTKRVAFVAHLGNTASEIRSGFFPQDYTGTQYTAVALASGVEVTQANYETAFKAVAGRKLVSAAPASDPALQPAFETASKNLYATILASEASVRDAAVDLYIAAEKVLSLETAKIDEVKAKAALDDMNAKRSSLSGEIATATATYNSRSAEYTARQTAYSAWQSGLPAATDNWEDAREAARDALDVLFVARTGLSQEMFKAEYALADAENRYYPVGASEPKKLETLSSELAAAETRYSNAKAAYESGSVANLTEFGAALEAVRVAEQELARKNYIMNNPDIKTARTTARQAALDKFGSNEASITSGVAAYNDSYTKGWKKEAGVTVRDATKDVAAYVDNTSRGSLTLAYADSYMGVDGQQTAPDNTQMNAAETDKEELEDMWFNVNSAIGDTHNPIDGQQGVYNLAVAKLAERQAASVTYAAAGSTYTANTTGSSVAGLITTGGSIVKNGNIPDVSAARTAFNSAKTDLYKKLAHIKVVGDRIVAYLGSNTVAKYSPSSQTA